jgi:hypothetical protein
MAWTSLTSLRRSRSTNSSVRHSLLHTSPLERSARSARNTTLQVWDATEEPLHAEPRTTRQPGSDGASPYPEHPELLQLLPTDFEGPAAARSGALAQLHDLTISLTHFITASSLIVVKSLYTSSLTELPVQFRGRKGSLYRGRAGR